MKQLTVRRKGAAETAARLNASVPARPWQLAPSVVLRADGLATRPTRREFLIGAGSLLVLGGAGCGGGESGEGPAGDTIRVEHADGVAEVPRDVDRIAALDGYPDLHSLLALGVVPDIAAVDRQENSPIIDDRLDEIEVTVERAQPNLEALAAAGPDLIFTVEYGQEIYDQLSTIAPTVILHRFEANVDEHLRTVARALGRPDDAERIIAEFEDRLAEVAGLVEGSRVSTMPFGVVQQYAEGGTFRVLGPSSYSGRTLEAVGMEGLIDPEGEPDGPEGQFGVNVSTELLADVLEPAEFIVVLTFPAFEGATPLADNPLWERLPAVRNGAVVEVPSDVWYQDTALTRTARLDDIEGLAHRFG